jgi:hypothetical protein
LSKNISPIIGCIYIPLSLSIDSYSEYCDQIESIALKFVDSYFFIAGDFNLNTFDWFKVFRANCLIVFQLFVQSIQHLDVGIMMKKLTLFMISWFIKLLKLL